LQKVLIAPINAKIIQLFANHEETLREKRMHTFCLSERFRKKNSGVAIINEGKKDLIKKTTVLGYLMSRTGTLGGKCVAGSKKLGKKMQ
jgi:hypothetical protein